VPVVKVNTCVAVAGEKSESLIVSLASVMAAFAVGKLPYTAINENITTATSSDLRFFVLSMGIKSNQLPNN
jgi:hypothetical protein